MIDQLITDLKAKLHSDEMDKIVVFGSSAIVLHGVPFREINDLDVFVSEEIFEKMQNRVPLQHKDGKGGEKVPYLVPGEKIEILKSFPGVSFSDVFSRAVKTETSGGLLVGSLADIKTWKLEQGRDKDLEDIKRIDQYLEKASTGSAPSHPESKAESRKDLIAKDKKTLG